MSIRLQLLGSPAVTRDGETFALPFERRSQVLAFLALRRSWVGRAELAAMLWPEQDSKLAYTNLRKTLFRIQSLPWAGGLEVQGGALRFDADTDVFAFETALREGRAGDAARLRRGEFLAGFEDDASEAWSGWLHFERDRLRGAWRGGVLAHLGEDPDPVDAIELSARLLEADPLDEAALHAHMAWLAKSGQGALAREAYREFTAHLQQELGLAPGATLQALHDSLSAASAAAAAMTSIPVPDDGFVGRAVELRRIAALLEQPGCRLVCLIGPGGVGKTRLVRRALHDLAPRYADGVAFVALEDAAGATDIASRIAREMGVALPVGRDPLVQVIDALRSRQVLLALDNFEHLAADAPMLAKLLDACPRLKIIVTSRARLGLAMEQLLPIEGLPCPDIEDRDHFESFDAARLFVKAARRVAPALVPENEAAAIVDICRQVEGLPLALELAAAWTRVLTCDAIAAQLRQGMELLRAADPAQPARHASMELVFDESWRLLTPVERDALARLSVFHGGFTAEAARAVAGAPLPVLGALADKSLLRKEAGRLHMHPLVQHLAAARLEGAALEEARAAHARHFHRLMAQLRRNVEDGDRETLQLIDTEFQNCRGAWTWASTHPMGEALARSVPALLNYCDHRFRVAEGLTLLRTAIDAAPEPKLEALLLAASSHLQYRMDQYGEAEGTARRALEATDPEGDEETRLQCLKVLAACSLWVGRPADAREFYKQALRQAPESVNPRNAAAITDNLALVEKTMGNYAETLRLSHQSLVQHRLLRDAAGEALCLNNLGSHYLDIGQDESAGPHLREGLALCERHGFVSTRALILTNLSDLALRGGDVEAAESHARQALEIAEAAANRALASWLKLQAARIALQRRDLEAARADLAQALELALAIGRPALKFSGVSLFAEVLAAQGESDCARRVLAFAADHPAIGATERDQVRVRLAKLPSDAAHAWPGLELDELVHRIVVERNVSYGPLVAALRRAAPQPATETPRAG
jgi:predicted ATPase/DNA-binding SARP family transcriptional activator